MEHHRVIARGIPGACLSFHPWYQPQRRTLCLRAPQERGGGSFSTTLRLVANDITARHEGALPQAGLSYEDALKFLRGESLVLSGDVPKGLVEVTFMGKILGQVKNIGTRANNLYPKPWRIKTTHIPTAYEPILKKI